MLGKPSLSRAAQWLNPAAFASPAAGSYGTMPIDAIQGPGRWNVDIGLTRSFHVAAHQAQFRFEAFNVFNHVNPSNPITAMNNPNFGRITSTATDPRILQVPSIPCSRKVTDGHRPGTRQRASGA